MFATASTSSWTFYSAVSSLLASFASFGAAGSTFDVEVSTTEALLAPVLLVEASSLLAAGCTYATGYDSSFEDSWWSGTAYSFGFSVYSGGCPPSS